MLSGCRSSSSVRQCCIVSVILRHWHRYSLFMACAPHLSFLVVILSLIMVWISHPRAGRVDGFVCWVVLVWVCGGE